MSLFSQKTLNAFNHLEPIDLQNLLDSNINKPARYMGHELGVKHQAWEKAKVRWSLTYPELYEVGASNLGHIILYSILNALPNQLCDRAYLPAKDFTKKLRENSQPLFAVESRRPLLAFDILGFSLSYELGATNILEMLDLAQVPIYAKDRGEISLNEVNSYPLIFAGGPTATSNPEPYAAFFDFFALGDGEELLPEIGLIVSESKKNNSTRAELLELLAEIPGVYVPSLYTVSKNKCVIQRTKENIPEKIIRRVATPMPFYAMGLVPNIETIHDRLTIEIRRGCTKGCRFCQPGMLTRPARDVNPEEVINAVEAGIKKTGYSDFTLLSLSCSDYLSLPSVGIELRNRLSRNNISLQLPSQRIDLFDENIAHILGGTRKSGLTFAPEAGTQRLRDVINKGLTDDDLLKGIRKAMENGYKKVKLYFMIGLPTETDSDIEGIASTCQWLKKSCKDLGNLNLNLTISNFTPKPHTPFQWHSVSTSEFQRKQNILRDNFASLKSFKINFTDVRISEIEDFIGRGDRSLAPVIKEAWLNGAGMDAWFESQNTAYAAWRKAITNAGLEGKYRTIELQECKRLEAITSEDLIQFCKQPLPWDHIDTGIDKNWLTNELERALKQETIPDCSFNACSQCGVCGPELGNNIVIQPPPIPIKEIYQSPYSEKSCRIRVQFSKTKPLDLISHLDLMRLLERALRRSMLPVSYTGGFHPLPRLQIALALPLGVEAFGEWMDIDFFEIIKVSEFCEKFTTELPEGLKIISSEIIPIKQYSLSQELSSAIWSFDLSPNNKQKHKPLSWQNGIEKIMNSKELIWHDKDKKGRSRKRDCRADLTELKIKNPHQKANQTAYSETMRFELNTKIDPMGRSLKPIYVKYWLEQYFEQPLEMKSIKRDELLLRQC